MITSDPTVAWNGEPAVLKGLILSVITTIVAIIAGQVTPLDGSLAIATAVVTFVVPLVQGYWTRRSVTPVSKLTQADSL